MVGKAKITGPKVLRNFNSQIAELKRGNDGGSVGHEVQAFLRLGEGDHIPDGRFTGQERHEAVQTQGKTAVRRGAVGEGFQQEAELELRGLGWNLQQLENEI